MHCAVCEIFVRRLRCTAFVVMHSTTQKIAHAHATGVSKVEGVDGVQGPSLAGKNVITKLGF